MKLAFLIGLFPSSTSDADCRSGGSRLSPVLSLSYSALIFMKFLCKKWSVVGSESLSLYYRSTAFLTIRSFSSSLILSRYYTVYRVLCCRRLSLIPKLNMEMAVSKSREAIGLRLGCDRKCLFTFSKCERGGCYKTCLSTTLSRLSLLGLLSI